MQLNSIPLKEVCSIQMGQSPPSSDYNTEGNGIPFFQGKAEFGVLHPIPDKYIAKPIRIAEVGEILLSVRAPVGSLNIADQKCCIGRGLAGLRFQGNQKYLYYFLKLNEQYLDSKGTGSTFKAINRDVIESLEIPVPLKRSDQDRIVERIESLFSEIDSGTRELVNAKQKLEIYRQSILNAAIQGKLLEQNKSDEPASDLLKKIEKEKEKLIVTKKFKKEKSLSTISSDEMPFNLPESWTWTRLGNLFYSCMYGTSQKCTEEAKGTPVLRIPNIGSGELDFSNLKYAKFSKSEIQKLSLQEGDLLIIRSNGSLNLVGTSCIFKKQEQEYLFAGYLIRLQFYASLVLPEYIDLFLKSPFGRQQIEGFAKSTSGVNNVNAQQLGNLIIPLPPTKEQMKIVEKIKQASSAMKDVNFAIEDNLKKSQQLKLSILKKAFAGDL